MTTPEPTRKSMLNLIQENLKHAGRVTFLHRIIIIGEHTYPESGIKDIFEKHISTINTAYCEAHLTGFLLYYPQYFMQMIEGTEDSQMKLLRRVMNEAAEKISKAKLLVAYHHINQRFFETWVAQTGKPPTLLVTFDPCSNIEETFKITQTCVKKLHNLLGACRNQSQIFIKNDYISSIENIMLHLPEYKVLDFLLNSNMLMDVKDYIIFYEYVEEIPLFKDMVWPVPTDFVPYSIFEEKIDPIEDLPE